jgi:hypothetical protein
MDLFDAHPSPSQPPMARFLGSCQRFPTRLRRRLENVHPLSRERLTPQVLQPLTPRWQRRGRGVSETLVMDTAWMRLTQKEEAKALLIRRRFFNMCRLCLPR